MLKSFKHFLII